MTSHPLVSIIIPVYNTEKYIIKCLESILNQTYKDIEIICVNDGSTDNSAKIIEKYLLSDSRVKLINQENYGLATARNVGIQNATGEYIYFIDSDDWVDENLISFVLDAIQKNNADVAMFDTYNVYNNSLVKVKRVSKFIQPEDIKVMYYKENDNIRDLQCMAWSKLYRKKFLTENNICFPDGVRFCEDVPFWFLLLFKDPKIVFINKFLYFYRKRSNSLTENTDDLIDKQWYTYQECIKTDVYKNAGRYEQLYILDYNTRMAIYNFSRISNLKYYFCYEKGLKKFSDEYTKFTTLNLLKLRGYKLLKMRHIYTICKRLYLWFLRHRKHITEV